MRFLAIAALALTAAATPAMAQDFEGPRAEVIGGWDRLNAGGEGQSGFVYGGGLGYDIQNGDAVFGVDAEITGSTADRDVNGVNLEAGRDLYAGVRAGYVVAPDTLLYAKGGYTNARLTASVPGDSVSQNFDGFRVGAGVEKTFGSLYGKTEYRYSNYSDGLSRHQVVAGVGLRF